MVEGMKTRTRSPSTSSRAPLHAGPGLAPSALGPEQLRSDVEEARHAEKPRAATKATTATQASSTAAASSTRIAAPQAHVAAGPFTAERARALVALGDAAIRVQQNEHPGLGLPSLEGVRALGISIDHPVVQGRTLLHLAVLDGSVGGVELLRDFGADPYVKDHNGKDAFDLLRKNQPPGGKDVKRQIEDALRTAKRPSRLERFTSKKPAVDVTKAEEVWTEASYRTAHNDFTDSRPGIGRAIEAMQTFGVPVDTAILPDGTTALMAALAHRYEEHVDALVRLGASFVVPNDKGETAIDAMSTWHNGRYWKKLRNEVLLSVDPNGVVMSKQRTPLHVAAADPFEHQLMAPLLERGAHPGLKDAEGMTPFDGVFGGHHSENNKLALLRSRALDPNDAVMRDGSTPLLLAAREGYVEIVADLVSRVDTLQPRTDGSTPLHAAIEGRYDPAVLQALLGAVSGEALDSALVAANEKGETALHAAASRHLVSAVELLVAKGAAADATTNARESPLHAALQPDGARHGASPEEQRLATVRALANAGADVNAPDAAAVLPLQRALDLGEAGRAIAFALIQAGARPLGEDPDGAEPAPAYEAPEGT